MPRFLSSVASACLPLALGLCFVIDPARAADDEVDIAPISDSRFLVKFKAREYDAETNRTRFRYRVNPEGRTEGAVRFVIGYGACGDVQIRLDEEMPKRVSDIRTDYLDPETGIFGVEWTSRLRRWRGTPFSFELVGDIPLGAVRIAVQEGDEVVGGLLPGPNCVPNLTGSNESAAR